MKLSARSDYVARAMIEIALGQAAGPVGIRAIVDRQQIPLKYLESLMPALKQAGLVKSVRGSRGGYLLSRPAKRITLLDIVSATETDTSLVEPEGPHPDSAVQQVWDRIEALVQSELSTVTLADLVNAQRELDVTRAPDYQI